MIITAAITRIPMIDHIKTSIKSLLFALAVLAVCPSCSQSVNDDISTAELAMNDSQFDLATQICDGIVDDNGLESLTSSQLVRLSILYMRLDEKVESGDNATKAANCYRTAYAVNADSAAYYYSSVSTTDMSLVQTLNQLVGRRDAAPVTDEDHEQIFDDDYQS